MGMWRSVGKEPDTPTILDKMDWNCWIVWSVGQIVCHYFFLECPSSCMSSWQPLPQDHDHQGQKQHDHPHHLHFSFSFACYFDIPKFTLSSPLSLSPSASSGQCQLICYPCRFPPSMTHSSVPGSIFSNRSFEIITPLFFSHCRPSRCYRPSNAHPIEQERLDKKQAAVTKWCLIIGID